MWQDQGYSSVEEGVGICSSGVGSIESAQGERADVRRRPLMLQKVCLLYRIGVKVLALSANRVQACFAEEHGGQATDVLAVSPQIALAVAVANGAS